MIIQMMLYGFIMFFAMAILSLAYFLYYSILFIFAIKKSDPNSHPIIKLGQDIYTNTKDPLDNMYIFEKLSSFSRQTKKAFPTGEPILDRSYAQLKRAEKVLAAAFIVLFFYSIIFAAVMFLVHGNQ